MSWIQHKVPSLTILFTFFYILIYGIVLIFISGAKDKANQINLQDVETVKSEWETPFITEVYTVNTT